MINLEKYMRRLNIHITHYYTPAVLAISVITDNIFKTFAVRARVILVYALGPYKYIFRNKLFWILFIIKKKFKEILTFLKKLKKLIKKIWFIFYNGVLYIQENYIEFWSLHWCFLHIFVSYTFPNILDHVNFKKIKNSWF